MQNEIKSEFKHIAVRSIFLNIAVYLVSIAFIGLNYSMPIGLLLGTGVMLLNLVVLYRSISRVVASDGKHARVIMMTGYIIRLLVLSVVTVAAFKFSFINVIGVLLPIFYPKLIYVSGAIFYKKGGV